MTEPSLRARSVADAAGLALSAFARAADRVFERRGLAPPRLVLPPAVLADLREVFGDSIDPEAVVIRRGHLPGIPHPRAFALPGLIYLGADPGLTPADLTSTDSTPTDSPRATPILVHELVHIWQGVHVGPRYVVEALWEQVRLGARAYDWRSRLAAAPGAPASVTPARPWSRALPVEAHAQLVSDAYAARLRGHRRVTRAVGGAVGGGGENGYDDEVAQALDELRRPGAARGPHPPPGPPAPSY